MTTATVQSEKKTMNQILADARNVAVAHTGVLRTPGKGGMGTVVAKPTVKPKKIKSHEDVIAALAAAGLNVIPNMNSIYYSVSVSVPGSNVINMLTIDLDKKISKKPAIYLISNQDPIIPIENQKSIPVTTEAVAALIDAIKQNDAAPIKKFI